jgi:glycosyltransferase involved in cell wall biosynthesis
MALKIAKPRLVHLWQDQTNIEVGIAAVLAGVPGILMSGRNMAPFRFPYHQDYMKECYGELLKLDGVSLMNNSKAGAKDYEEWLGLEPGSVEVIYNAVDTEYLSGSQKGDEGDSAERLVSGIFRFYPEKRPLLWLKVAKQVYKAEPNTRFEIAGTGPLLDEAKEFAKENGLEGIVTFLGSTKKVKELLDRSDCLLLVSDREGLPNVILEAQSMGVPVVTSNAGGAAECLVENESGVVIRSDVRDDYVEALLKCLRDPEWLMRARETARENVEAKFRVGVSLAGFRGLYDKILAS